MSRELEVSTGLTQEAAGKVARWLSDHYDLVPKGVGALVRDAAKAGDRIASLYDQAHALE